MGSRGTVISVNSSPQHGFSKQPQLAIRLLAGRGVEGDAHCGETVQHLYLKRKTPLAPNRMQLHLLQAEVFDDLAQAGFTLRPGELGENITTRGIDLLSLPAGARLHVGEGAVVELTGLRTPCIKIDRLQAGLLKQVTPRDEANILRPTAGVMAIVLHGGDVSAGAEIRIELPEEPHVPMRMI